MNARWKMTDDHLTLTWPLAGGEAVFNPDWIAGGQPGEEQSNPCGVDMSSRSPFGGAYWYAYKLCERRRNSPADFCRLQISK